MTLFSQEVEDFVLEIIIGADATFADLHELILKDCGYGEHERQSFLICDEEWRVKDRISLRESDDFGYDEDVNLMARTRLRDFLEDEGQRLAYIFDPEGKRFFLMELSEILFHRAEDAGKVNRRHGVAPTQFIVEEEEETTPQTSSENIEEQFYGDDGFEAEELDMEGYEIDE